MGGGEWCIRYLGQAEGWGGGGLGGMEDAWAVSSDQDSLAGVMACGVLSRHRFSFSL